MATPAHSTTRHNLAQRIERFLRAHTLSDWQADQVFMAIEMLDAELFGEGERIMMYVEKPKVWAPVAYVPAGTREPRDGKQLLEQLKRALVD